MGCDPSKQQSSQIISVSTDQTFKLSYKQLVCLDNEQVFKLYHFSSVISRSNYSVVRRVVHRNNRFVRVCKLIPFKKKSYFNILSEIQFLRQIDHPNTVQIVQYFIQPSFLYLIMEQIPGKKIMEELIEINDAITFNEIIDIIKQILSAVDYFHRKNIAHRALNLDNILLIWKKGVPLVKIIDFSQASVIGSASQNIYANKRAIQLPKEEYENGKSLDIFDCGFLLFNLLSGRKLKYDDYREVLADSLELVQKLDISDQISTDLKYIFKYTLAIDPKQRFELSTFLKLDIFHQSTKQIKAQKALKRLLNFNSDSNLKYLVSMYGSLKMTSTTQKAEYLIQFYNLDQNQDGQIQLEQLVEGIANTLGLSKQQATVKAQKIFIQLDKNKSGSINFSQFVLGTIKLSKIMTNQFLVAIFKQMDVNNNGLVSEQEINSFIAGVGKSNILQGKKQLNFSQFKAKMTKIIRQSSSFEFQ